MENWINEANGSMSPTVPGAHLHGRHRVGGAAACAGATGRAGGAAAHPLLSLGWAAFPLSCPGSVHPFLKSGPSSPRSHTAPAPCGPSGHPGQDRLARPCRTGSSLPVPLPPLPSPPPGTATALLGTPSPFQSLSMFLPHPLVSLGPQRPPSAGPDPLL